MIKFFAIVWSVSFILDVLIIVRFNVILRHKATDSLNTKVLINGFLLAPLHLIHALYIINKLRKR